MAAKEDQFEPVVPPESIKADRSTGETEALRDFLQVLHDCLDTDEQRLVAYFVFAGGLKRGDFLRYFDGWSASRYDRMVSEVRELLQNCPAMAARIKPRPAGQGE